ncbi:hypothetical protein [Streptomyces sp. NPDC048340]|uniref:hypothetical protein n=1 Tax=Streptomyces sp. NPDC048340 TaxID=3365537 RepID=UPI003714A5EC
MFSFTHKRNVVDPGIELTYRGKQSQAKARGKARQVDDQVREYLKKGGGGPFAGNGLGGKLADFCTAYGITGEGRKDLARQLLERAMRDRSDMRRADQQRIAGWEKEAKAHAQRVLDQAPAWFYGSELGCAYIAQLFRLCNRAPEQDLADAPSVERLVKELKRTLQGQGRDAEVDAMMPVFAQILGMPKEKAAAYFRAEFKAPSGRLDGTYYRAEVLSRLDCEEGDVLRTQAPTSISGKREKAEDFFEHRKKYRGASGVDVLYVFDAPQAKRLRTALDVSSTGEGEAVVPDRAFFRVTKVLRQGSRVEVHLTPIRSEQASRTPWSWLGHDAGLRLPARR